MKHGYVLVLFLLYAYGGIAQSSFSGQLNIPDDVVQGNSCIFELEIYKPSDIRGYTVFTQEFPKGFYVKAIDLQGAEFSYSENLLQLTWVRIPADEKITVTYEVSPAFGLTGQFHFSGQLTYMIAGKQGKFDFKDYTFNVLKEKKPIRNTTNNSDDAYASIHLNKKLYNDVKTERKITYHSKKKIYIVEVMIQSTNGGSCHLVEQIPAGFTFQEDHSENALLTVQKDKASFKWKNLPKKKELRVKYKLQPEKDQTKKPDIIGKLSLLKDGQLIDIQLIN